MIICSCLQKLASRVGQGWGSRSSVIWGGSHFGPEWSLLLHAVIEQTTLLSLTRRRPRWRSHDVIRKHVYIPSFLPPLCEFNSLFTCHPHVCVAALSTPVVPESLAVPTHRCLFTQQPLLLLRFLLLNSTGDAMKGHVYRSSQHLASALACSLLLLLATGAGTTATKRVCHSPQRCGRSSDGQAKHCPGFTAWQSTLEYTLTSLCQPNYVYMKKVSLTAFTYPRCLITQRSIYTPFIWEWSFPGQSYLSPSFREDTAPVMARITLSSIVTVVCLSPSGSERQLGLFPRVSSVTTPAEQPVYCISAEKKGFGFSGVCTLKLNIWLNKQIFSLAFRLGSVFYRCGGVHRGVINPPVHNCLFRQSALK